MATIDYNVRVRQDELDLDVNPPIQEVTLATLNSHVAVETIAANDADGLVTLWASTMALGAFKHAVIEVDPAGELTAADAAAKGITLEITTAAGTTFAVVVYRNCPFILTSNVAGVTAAAATSTIASFKARNLNAAGALKVRAALAI